MGPCPALAPSGGSWQNGGPFLYVSGLIGHCRPRHGVFPVYLVKSYCCCPCKGSCCKSLATARPESTEQAASGSSRTREHQTIRHSAVSVGKGAPCHQDSNPVVLWVTSRLKLWLHCAQGPLRDWSFSSVGLWGQCGHWVLLSEVPVFTEGSRHYTTVVQEATLGL